MKFWLKTSGNFYSKEDKEKLETLGFKFENSSELVSDETPFAIRRNVGIFIVINSLEELMNFQKKWGDIIVGIDDGENYLEIYDDYK